MIIQCVAMNPDNIHISYKLPLLNFSEGDGNSSSKNGDVDDRKPGDVRCVHAL